MEMEPARPSAKKMKLAASSVLKAANDPNPPTTTEISEEQLPGADEDGKEEMLDRISNLPDAVLGEIISLLPTREGARTQALASRWRHLWRAAPLNVDYRRLPGHRDRQDVLVGVILSAHQGPGRRLCLPAPRLQYRADAADAWFRSPALDNLQELDLYLAYIDTLRFPQLRKLALVAVEISECSPHSIITKGCPVLECLLLNTCFGIRRLQINSPTLISIGIHSSSDQLIIDNGPSLQRLVHFGLHMEMQVTVVSAPKLETLGYVSEYFGQSKIVFGSTVIQVILTTMVCTVKILAINLYMFDLDMVVDLMRCFPRLEKFYIKLEKSGETRLWRSKHRDLLGSLDIRLKTLVLGCYQGIQPQVNLATFIVSNAIMLESIRLEVEPCNYNECFFTEQHRRLQMEKRACKDARLCFTRNCPQDALTVVPLCRLDLTDPFACGC
ncbi:hypothetical protein ACQ4PT_032987 [Festuca glaucescens]